MSREVLPNKLGITDPQQLAEYELEVAAARVAEIASHPERFVGDFDFAHLQRLHAYILQDVYEWAGHMRTTETKAIGMPHCRVEFLADETAQVSVRSPRPCRSAPTWTMPCRPSRSSGAS